MSEQAKTTKKCLWLRCNTRHLLTQGYCKTHYYHWKKDNHSVKCTVLGCQAGVHAISLCSKHYRETNNYRKKKNANMRKYRSLRGRAGEKEYVKARTPAWSQLREIHRFYAKCPEGYHVDHIIPLRGEIVSGLHVLENLQYLPAKDNLRKGNKWTP